MDKIPDVVQLVCFKLHSDYMKWYDAASTPASPFVASRIFKLGGLVSVLSSPDTGMSPSWGPIPGGLPSVSLWSPHRLLVFPLVLAPLVFP